MFTVLSGPKHTHRDAEVEMCMKLLFGQSIELFIVLSIFSLPLPLASFSMSRKILKFGIENIVKPF